jgi:Kef-type K+ transport system membrane component KefB
LGSGIDTQRRNVSRLLSAVAYVAMLLSAVGVFALVRSYGANLTAPPPPLASTAAAGATSGPDALLHVLLALTAVLITGRLLGKLLGAISQPPVIGEVLGGILLGPSLLGRIAPELSSTILPITVAPYLGVIAEFSIILYMFLIGLDLHVDLLRGRARDVVVTSHASIVTPFILGTLLALYLYPRLSTSDVPFTNFALFMGVAMSITAFPVLARIVTDRGLNNTRLGTVALACAAADDVSAWCLLAFIVGVTRGSVEGAFMVVVLTILFVVVMVTAVRPFMARFSARVGDHAPSGNAIAIVLAGLLVSALVAQRIGTHAIFGAFLFGAITPRQSGLARALREKLHDLVTILLLPAFFAFTGMRTQVGLVAGAWEWMVCGLIIGVATLGKFGGTFVGARLTGTDWRTAASLGVLMNTRGLMELIVLNVGRDLNVISPTLFTMMVLMALVTTIATTPILDSLAGEMVLYNRRSGFET